MDFFVGRRGTSFYLTPAGSRAMNEVRDTLHATRYMLHATRYAVVVWDPLTLSGLGLRAVGCI